MYVSVIGGGLAGVEAAWQIAKRDIPVKLFEMRPERMTPAHSTGALAELVCSNSFRSTSLANAVGLLKEEMKVFDSIIMEAAFATAVPAGLALAVDRIAFSEYIKNKLTDNSYIELICAEIKRLPQTLTVVAAGPLMADALSQDLSITIGETAMFFHDAIAPIISGSSINYEKCFWASRYGKGGGKDYLNCPMSKEQYDIFRNVLLTAKLHPLHDFEDLPDNFQAINTESLDVDVYPEKTFEGCLPIETLAKRGENTLRFGPMKPVGLSLPTEFSHMANKYNESYAVVQLRKENVLGSLFNLVGFQTRLKRNEQSKLIRLIPGLEECEIERYGAMHRNSFINSPKVLLPDLRLKMCEHIFMAGQITGVEGYVESAACGLAAGINAARQYMGLKTFVFPLETALGSLLHYLVTPNKDFQPMNVTFGLMPPINNKKVKKTEKKKMLAERALSVQKQFIKICDI